MGMACCEICRKPCDNDKGENETCAECGLVVCQAHCVVDDRERPLCLDCGLLEAQRQMMVDAPGVWPDWLVVWADINDENPTHIIALDGAKLSSRWNQPE